MAPNDTRTPFQIAQAEEARGRQQQTVDDAGNNVSDPHQDRIDDGTGNDIDPARSAPERQEQRQEERDEPVDRRSPGDIKRAEMAARFRKRVTEQDGGDVPYNGDPNDPEMQFGKFGRKEEAEPEPGATIVGERVEPEVEQRQQQEQPKKKLIVRGKELWLTDSEILARASMVEAADTYLEESKALMAEARDIRNSAKRSGQDPQHPEGQTGTQEDELNLDNGQERQHPDELEQAIEEIQFGDPKEAAAKIRKVITKASDESADQRQLTRLIDNDLATSQKALKDFMDQNPDLAKDKVANVVLEQNMYDIYREDITKLGIDPALIPKDNAELANWHRFYRVNGKSVRSTAEALKAAKTDFDKWRGVAPKPAPQQRQQPRIDVNVDRTARRENIQSQPTRAVAPRPDAVRQAPTTKSRSDIVMDMRRRRGQVV